MARRGEQRLGRRLLHHLAGVHHLHAMRGLRDHAHVVRDQHQRHAALAAASSTQKIENLLLDGHVERGRGLVGDQQARVAGDRHRDHHALVHAARHLVRERAQPRGRRGDADLVEQLHDAVAHLPPRHRMMHAQRLADLPADRVARVQRGHRLLEDHRHVLADQLAPLARADGQQVGAGEPHRVGAHAAGIADQPHRGQHRDALPEPLSPTMQRISPSSSTTSTPSTARKSAARGRELDAQVADFEQRHQRFNFGSSASRSPSPNRLNASTVIRIAMPGKVSTHHAR